MEFKKVALAAIGYVIEYKRPLSKALLIPFVLYMVLDAAELSEHNLLTGIALWGLAVIVQTIFAITTHRVILLGPKSIPTWGLFKWTKRESFFALHAIGLSLMMIPAAVLGFIPFLGGVAALGLICWLFGRMSLVFPAIAIDQGVSFKLSWELTESHQMLMFLVIIVFPAVLLIPAYLLSFLPYTFIATSIVISFLTTLSTIFTVAALSVSYKLICEEAND